jgi:hypothetical protein
MWQPERWSLLADVAIRSRAVLQSRLTISLFRVSFIHAVLDERPAVISREVLLVGEILADIHLVLLTHVVKFLITTFTDAVLHKILAIVSLEPLTVGRTVTSFDFVRLR